MENHRNTLHPISEDEQVHNREIRLESYGNHFLWQQSDPHWQPAVLNHNINVWGILLYTCAPGATIHQGEM